MTLSGSVTPAAESLAAAFTIGPDDPAWLGDLREEALGGLRSLGLPTTRHEDWRYTSLTGLSSLRLDRARPDQGDEAAALLDRAGSWNGPQLVFANGRYRSDLSRVQGLPPGAVLISLGEALREVPDLVHPHLGRLAGAGRHALVDANTALFDDGVLLHLPVGGAVAPPIRIVHLTALSGRVVATFPRLLLVAGEGSLVTVVEHSISAEGARALVVPVTEIVLAPGAEVNHYRFQEEGLETFELASLHVEQAAESRFTSHSLALGGQVARAELHARLLGEKAELTASGLGMASASRITDAFVNVEHVAAHCTSNQTFKTVLDGRARGVFTGRVRVAPHAQKTQAQQSSSNLLLSDDATVDTRPQLEILADDVKCSHGGTVGQLDPTSLFYLRSRGLSEPAARSLLIYAFAAGMVELVRPEPLRARARQLVASRLPDGARLVEAA
jgi:Fe-S cluster assembly protein SufD